MKTSNLSREGNSKTSNNQPDDSCLYTLVYKAVNKYLTEDSIKPQKLSIISGQSAETNYIAITVEEISKEKSLKLARTQYFEAAYDEAEHRKNVHKACQQARKFFYEHILNRNPFPPRKKFNMNVAINRERLLQRSELSESITASSMASSGLRRIDSTTSLTCLHTAPSSSAISIGPKMSEIKRNSSLHEIFSKSKKKPRVPNSILTHAKPMADKSRKIASPPVSRPSSSISSVTTSEERRLMNAMSNPE
ncbi:unnamed protein product [Caenorhabditis bovis]|uniref:Uncharacterized protein n=1 Tax=Caenorhabditis bovis TaxID=2654633 RepID=A0A8S1EX37_9PELO|nr:unnamed protein product [Caenorhabditis bovis]